MKKFISAIVIVLLLASVTVCAASDNTVRVRVSVSDGSPVLVLAEVEVTDRDGDGDVTLNDALIAAHEKYYKGGAEEGYLSVESQYGRSLVKLWGVENGGGYGYYVNDFSAMGLTDRIKDGDSVYAYIYTDTTGYSDKYCFFDIKEADVRRGGSINITLSACEFDENWQTVIKPVAGAEITIDGKKTGVVTDSEGKASVRLTKTGDTVIGAVSENAVLVPPVLRAEVSLSDADITIICAVIAAVIICAIVSAVLIRKAKRIK